MDILTGLDLNIKNSAVSLGKFDGIHRGHRLLLNEILKHDKYIPTVFTFKMSNDNEKEATGRYIYSEQEKEILLESLGIKRVILFPFNEDTKNMEPEDFIEKFLIERLDAKFICVGEDFRFGRDRRGSVGMLKKFASEFGYDIKIFHKLTTDTISNLIPKDTSNSGLSTDLNNEIISSTLIRKKIETGDLSYANKLLGKTYFAAGRVLHGNALGHKLDMPTANIIPRDEKVLLPLGVYATTTVVKGKRYNSVTNIGRKPTIGSNVTGIETYLIDFNKDIYGMDIIVEFHEFIRPEKKFPNIAYLKEQMEKDKKKAAEILTSY